MSLLLKAVRIKKKYHNNLVLNELDFNLKRGEIVAIVGPSGSGKSTLLHILGLLEKPNEGQFFFNGQLTNQCSDDRLSQIRLNDIGFVYQFHHLLPEFSVIENILITTMIRSHNHRLAMKQKASDLLQYLGIEQKAFAMTHELSGGEKQRVAIARALVNNPLLVLADEPTGNLDFYNAEEVFALFLQEVRKSQRSVLIVTHNLNLAKKCDRILSMELGVLKEWSETFQANQ